MLNRALCPVIVGRDDALNVLEDALVDASRGDSRLVAVGGEAGVGKTRLTSELAVRARKLGFEVMTGGCSEAALQLPYLPFVEALGNWIDSVGADTIAERLGPARRELAQLFPALSDGGTPDRDESGQARLRLFEAVVALLTVAARERGIVLVIEDVHWADTSTIELMDHCARRLAGVRALIVPTYRSDELTRKHPLRPVLQAWRRTGVAETVALEPLEADGVRAMIAAILAEDEISDELRDLLYERTEGNPFVLEEMLKDAIDRGDIFRTPAGWDRKPIEQFAIPESVRDTILLRLDRLDPGVVSILEAAAVLGRSFDWTTLAKVSGADEQPVLACLTTATAEQLLEDDDSTPGRYRWRHALTQESVYAEMLLPRRQALHSRAADVIGAERLADQAHHLLGAGRFEEAARAALAVADAADVTIAADDAQAIVERALPHVSDPVERARVLGRLGRLLVVGGSIRRAREVLKEAIDILTSSGLEGEAAAVRTMLGRAYWEGLDSDRSLVEFEAAREILERSGPSAELAAAYRAIASLHAFRLERDEAAAASQRAVDIATAAGSDMQRVWASSFLALTLIDGGRTDEGMAMLQAAGDEALRINVPFIAGNAYWNLVWEQTHVLHGDPEPVLERLGSVLSAIQGFADGRSARSYADFMWANMRESLEEAQTSRRRCAEIGAVKREWRAAVRVADALLMLGRPDEARAAIPSPETRVDPQDVVYDARARIGIALVSGSVDDALAYAQDILGHGARYHAYPDVLRAASRAFVAAGDLVRAREAIARDGYPGTNGRDYLLEAEAVVEAAAGNPDRAAALFREAIDLARSQRHTLLELQARAGLAEALAASDRHDEALNEARALAIECRERGLLPLQRRAESVVLTCGGSIEHVDPVDPEPAAVPVGERLVTSMFADVRDYTASTGTTTPHDNADRMARLYRTAKVEVEREFGIVDKFAGDAVMATFNVTGTTIDHTVQAVRAALALRDKAALADTHVGVGIAVGPAVVGSTPAAPSNVMVLGSTTNLAARLQTAAGPGEIVLSEEAHRRVADWLAERGIDATSESLQVKGFDDAVIVYRLRAPASDK